MYYFIFGINNSGTTVVSQYLAAQTGAYLPPFGNWEGQDAPSVREIFRTNPWRREKNIDWAYVRSEWDKLRHADGNESFIDASPVMLQWVDEIREAFGENFSAIFLVSSPYMQIASCLKNYTKAPLTDAKIDAFTGRWLKKARMQVENRAVHPDIPLLTYEDICVNGRLINRAFDIPFVKGATGVIGKGSAARKKGRVRPMRDMSVRTIAFLSPDELTRISDALASETLVLEELGYTLLDRRAQAERLAKNPKQAAAGRARRQRWEAGAT